jgi:intracellular septation protein A
VFLASKNIYLATSVGMGLSALQIGWGLARKAPIGMLQWAGLSLIAVFGAATLLTGDPRFVMFKPTGINLALGAVMLKRGWMERYAPENIRDLARPMLNVFGYVWSAPMSIAALFLIQNVFMRAHASGRRRPSDGAAARA